MSRSWFYLAGDQAIGPVSLEDLRAAGCAGLVRHDTRVRHGKSGDWRPAGEVAELLPPAPYPFPAPGAPPPLPQIPTSSPAEPAAEFGPRPLVTIGIAMMLGVAVCMAVGL